MNFSLVRGIIYAGLLVFYFIRICDQADRREAVLKNFLKKESSRGTFFETITNKTAEDRNEQVALSLNDKKQKAGFRLIANEVSFITAKSRVQQSR
jgi:hypothetical protein